MDGLKARMSLLKNLQASLTYWKQNETFLVRSYKGTVKVKTIHS